MTGDHIKSELSRRDTLSLSLYHCGFERCPSDHSYGPAVRDHYLIHYVTDGKGEFESNGKIYHLGKGDLFLIEPGQTTTYRALPEDPYRYYWVGFHGTDAAKLVHMSGLSKQEPIVHYDKDDRLLVHLQYILASSDDPIAGEYITLGHLYLFLSCLIKEASYGRKKTMTYGSTLDRAVRYVHGNYSRDISVKDIADFVKTDRSHLFRIFKKELGVSPQEYLIDFRLTKSRELLGYYDLNISQVAYSVGYDDPAQFSRLFKKKYTVSPSRYSTEVSNGKW